jgi:hypothetical protein
VTNRHIIVTALRILQVERMDRLLLEIGREMGVTLHHGQ